MELKIGPFDPENSKTRFVCCLLYYSTLTMHNDLALAIDKSLTKKLGKNLSPERDIARAQVLTRMRGENRAELLFGKLCFKQL